MTPALLKEIKKKKSLYQKCMQIKADSPNNFDEHWEIYKKQKKEMTLGHACRTILKEGRDTVLNYIYSITEKKEREIESK